MKANSKPVHPKRRIKTLHDLELEKQRLQFEILKVEERMKFDFRRVYEYFTLRQAFRIVTNDLSLTGKAFSRGFSIVRNLLSRRKNNNSSKTRHR
jgi:hypothetical protein